MLGSKCREWRIERGLTQKDVAKVAHCDNSLVSLFESGKRRAPSVLRGFLELGFKADAQEIIEHLETGFDPYLQKTPGNLGQEIIEHLSGGLTNGNTEDA